MTADTAAGRAAPNSDALSSPRPVLSDAELLGGEQLSGEQSFTLSSLDDAERWVGWREDPDPKTGKLRKIPYQPRRRDAKASSTTPSTWGTRQQAENRAAADRLNGVGIILGTHDGLTIGGVDLDDCLDTATGKIERWAQDAITRFGSYAEISPSGRGIKILFLYDPNDLAALPEKARIPFSQGEHREMALDLRDRYYAITNDRVPDCTTEIRAVPLETLKWFVDIAGPAFKAAGAGNGKRDRSSEAFGIAFAVKRDGGTFEDFKHRLLADPVLAEWAKDKRQVDRAWKHAEEPTPEDLFDEVDGFDATEDDQPLKKYPSTEDGVALTFRDRYRTVLRFCHTSGCWFQWAETHWRKDETQLAFSYARRECREAGKRNPEAKALSKAAACAGVEKLAKTDRAFSVTDEFWDRDPWLIGTPGGTVDLREGLLREADSKDGISKLTRVAPDSAAGCPRWLQFLHDATAGDAELIRFLQQWCGYTLTGDTREQALLFIYGTGGNGKGVFLNTISRILGDYSRTAGMEVLTVSRGDRHPQELARLRGARMVCASETEEGRAWAEVRIKQLTGGDTITARFMRQNDFEFRPEFKLLVVGNHKPILRNVDEAARRRFNVVPFEHKPPKADRQLEEKLRAEFPAILAWMIAGCLDWQANGLVRPSVVADATEDYFSTQDIFGQWLEDRCEVGPGYATSNAELWSSYQAYVQDHGEGLYGKSRGFPDALQARGFRPIKDGAGIRGRGFAGLRLRNVFDEFEGGSGGDT